MASDTMSLSSSCSNGQTQANVSQWMSNSFSKMTREQIYYYQNQPTTVDRPTRPRKVGGPALFDSIFSQKEYTAEMAATRLELSLRKSAGHVLSHADTITLANLNERASLNLKRDKRELNELVEISVKLDDILSVLG
jgi:hypothetical protein